MEESIGLIVTPTIMVARFMGETIRYQLENSNNERSNQIEIKNLKMKDKSTFEFLAYVSGKPVKYIYMFRSIIGITIDGLNISGINITPTVLRDYSISEIEKVLRSAKNTMQFAKYDPFTALDCLLPGFIR